MKLSYNWLKDYIDLDVEPEKLSVLLTDCGLEVEGMEKVESIKGGLQGVLIGQVMSCEPHPNADRLSVTTVKLGDDKVLPIVCGAPNVAKGQKVLVATVGTTLYDGDQPFKIKKSKIRGEVSEGMICAEDELGLGSSHDGIMVLDDEAPVGEEASSYFNIEQDYVYEIGLTPNRADATSHIGSARDLVAVLNHFFPDRPKKRLSLPDVSAFAVDNHNLPVAIEIKDTEACPRYTGLTMENIQVGPSPEWLQNRLKAVGLRPINNIVDITNYVLMETGHPLHAFDYDKINGKKVVIEKSPAGTRFVTLDEVKRELSGNDLMICDKEKPMCIAGVFGGLHSGVSDQTSRLFLESAYFDPATIRKTSKYHGLKTDASFRFERGADPNITVYALKRAALLIKELAGGKVASDIVDVYPQPIDNWQIELRLQRVNMLVGKQIPTEVIKNILSDLDMKIVRQDDLSLLVEVPTFKVDVTREIDLIEEILRVYGYNNVETSHQIKSAIAHKEHPDVEKINALISDMLVSRGFLEAMNNSLTKKDYYDHFGFSVSNNVNILNPLSSELNVLRQSLVFGLLESVSRNIKFKQKDLKLFEFGKTYHYSADKEALDKYKEKKYLSLVLCGSEKPETWKFPSTDVSFYTVKEAFISILNKLHIASGLLKLKETEGGLFQYGVSYQYRGLPVAKLGLLQAGLIERFEIDSEVFYAEIDWEALLAIAAKSKVTYSEISKYPSVRRDLALLVDKQVTFGQLEEVAFKVEKNLLKSVNLFDIYEGKGIPDGKKSYALSFILEDTSKTLTDKQIDKIMRKIQGQLERSFGAQLR